MKRVYRRTFLAGLASAGAACTSLNSASIQNLENSTRQPVCIFSKHLQWLNFDQMAEVAASAGFDGIDLTVRPGGHVEPERVEEDLPAAHRAVTKAGLMLPLMTTAITDPSDPVTQRVLSTAGELEIGHYRMGYYRYRNGESIDDTLSNVGRNMSGLAELNERYGVVGDYQNHAGLNYFGASLWDLWYLLRNLDPKWIGCQFDLRHASVEGAMNWPVDFRRLSDRTHSLVAKDFEWKVGEGGSEVVNVPLGQGIANFKTLFSLFEESRMVGPISLHLEYPLGGANHGARQLSVPRSEVESAMKRDLQTLRSLLRQ